MSDSGKYTVGWICAITAEYVAALRFLDEEHDAPTSVAPTDSNAYTLGRMGKHHVVITVLPEYGTTSAAVAASNMLTAFPNVRLGLMVGIGGGVPSKRHDVRLGDVVVSRPTDSDAGVFQYDFGRTIQDRQFQYVGSLNKPPNTLLAAARKLEAKHQAEGHDIEAAVEKVLNKSPRLRKKYERPSQDHDRLYRSDAVHPPKDIGDGCSEQPCAETCGSAHLITRPQRDEDDRLVVHYGLIASANQVMKDARLRDELTANKKDLLCFEMEAAGLMNHFPSLVVRGICDYADSHKSKEWQGFAAMAAAAYAKDILGQVPPTIVEAERPLVNCFESGRFQRRPQTSCLTMKWLTVEVSRDLRQTMSLAEITRVEVADLASQSRKDKIHQWLSPPDESTNLHFALNRRHGGSGEWFLRSSSFTDWKNESRSFLWLHGIPGCGKTILSSTIVQHLQQPGMSPLLFFFFDFNDTSKQSFGVMLRCLVYQCYYKKPGVQRLLDMLFVTCDNGRSQPSMEALLQVFIGMLESPGSISIIIDALDECQGRQKYAGRSLMSWVRTLRRSPADFHLLVTSRPEHDIRTSFSQWIKEREAIRLEKSLIREDISQYVSSRVHEDEGFARWHAYPDVQKTIISTLLEKADGMFRLVSLQLDDVEKCPDLQTLKQTLLTLPTSLEETYERIIRSIPSQLWPKTQRLLQFLVYATRPMKVDELVDVLAVDLGQRPRFKTEDRLPVPIEIASYCSSLVSLVDVEDRYFEARSGFVSKPSTELRLAHFSVKEWVVSTHLNEELSTSLNRSLANASIAMVCLGYLIELDSIAFAESTILQSGEDHLWKGTPLDYRPLYPLADYAMACWADHAVAGGKHREDICSLTLEMFSRPQVHLASLRNCFRRSHRAYARSVLSSPLLAACLWGIVPVIEYLVDNGADVNQQGPGPITALQMAAAAGHENALRVLLQRGADPDVLVSVANTFGRKVFGSTLSTVLSAAMQAGQDSIVQELLDAGADPNKVELSSGAKGPLQIAASEGRSRAVQELVRRGANVNARYGGGWTALMLAEYWRHFEVARILVGYGAYYPLPILSSINVARGNPEWINWVAKASSLPMARLMSTLHYWGMSISKLSNDTGENYQLWCVDIVNDGSVAGMLFFHVILPPTPIEYPSDQQIDGITGSTDDQEETPEIWDSSDVLQLSPLLLTQAQIQVEGTFTLSSDEVLALDDFIYWQGFRSSSRAISPELFSNMFLHTYVEINE